MERRYEMGVNQVTKRGKTRIEVRKRWPDGTEYRRVCPNKTKAGFLLRRIESSIDDGTWRDYREELKLRDGNLGVRG